MANSSDGGKGDHPDPPNANINTDALSTSTPAACSAKNDSVLSKTDQDTQLSVTLNLDDNQHIPNKQFPTSKSPTKITDNAGANITAVTTSHPTISTDKNDPANTQYKPNLILNY